METSERRDTLWCALLICACFTLTSEAWIQWHYHLMTVVPSQEADVIAMVAGYLMQACGIGIAAVVARRSPGALSRLPMVSVIAAHFVCSVPAALGTSAVGSIAFGLLMSLLCGIVAAYYLQSLATRVPSERRGVTFGAAYACSTILTWLLSIAQNALGQAIPVRLAIGVALSIVVALLVVKEPATAPGSDIDGTAATAPIDNQLVAVASIAVLFMSLVKNVGFSFPSSDIMAGVSMETSRLFYAVGLVAAGLINDHKRQHGAILCIAALVTPFALLAVSGEPIPATALWAADYLFYGFFSVYRVVLFADLGSRENKVFLAGLGLMFGRIGDALGTAVCRSLGANTMVLVVVAVALFAASVFVTTHLFQLLYASPVVVVSPPARSEKEVFDSFSSRYDLSQREREVLRQVLAERTNAEAAAELFVAESTVKFHVRNLLKKTGCKNRLELIALYASDRDA